MTHDLIDRTAVLTRIHAYAVDDKLSGDEMAIFLRLAREVAAMPVVRAGIGPGGEGSGMTNPWQLIATAPLDGTLVDLWSAKGWRYPDAKWGALGTCTFSWCDAQHCGSIEAGGPFTHWMRPPAGPEGEG